MASALLLVVLAAVYGIWFGLQRTYGFTEEDLRAQSEARAAMNEMVEFIRTARQPDDPAVSDDHNLVIVEARPNSLICWTDVDHDAGHDVELVQFQVYTDESTGDGSLYRYTSQTDIADFSTFPSGSQTKLVGSYVANSDDDLTQYLFTYWGNGVELGFDGDMKVADPSKIREVHINLLVDVIIGEAPASHVLSSVVQPRNLRTY